MIRLFLFVALILSIHQVFSQETLLNNKIQGISISYFGEGLTHYGIKIGTEYSLKITNKTKIKRNSKEIPKRKEHFLTGNIGSYIHKRNHVGLFINSEIGYRKTRNKGFKYEFLIGIGYLHTFLQGDTYTVSDNGDVEKVNLAGQSNLMIPLSFGLGYDFNLHHKKPFSLYLKPGFFIQYPYNHALVIRPTIDLGLFYYFNK